MYFIVDFLVVDECALRGNNLSILVIITGYCLTLFFECGVRESLMVKMLLFYRQEIICIVVLVNTLTIVGDIVFLSYVMNSQ